MSFKKNQCPCGSTLDAPNAVSGGAQHRKLEVFPTGICQVRNSFNLVDLLQSR